MKKLSRWIASALFTMTLGETFEWVQSVLTGERPRVTPRAPIAGKVPVPAMDVWSQPERLKPSAG